VYVIQGYAVIVVITRECSERLVKIHTTHEACLLTRVVTEYILQSGGGGDATAGQMRRDAGASSGIRQTIRGYTVKHCIREQETC
jgi:hypothetical protein